MRQQVLQAQAALRIRVYFRQRGARSFHALSGRHDLYLALENRYPVWLVQAGQRDMVVAVSLLVTCICTVSSSPGRTARGSTDSG